MGPGLNDTFIILDKPVAEADADNIVDGRLVWPIPPFEVMLSFEEVSGMLSFEQVSGVVRAAFLGFGV